jgi:hypothetical protein
MILLAILGCSKKPDVKTRISELERVFAPEPTTAPAPAEPAANAGVQLPDAATVVRAALSAVRSNDYAGGVIALQVAQRIPGSTAAQLMAAEQAKQALVSDLVTRASRGEAKAMAELQAIEKTLSQ